MLGEGISIFWFSGGTWDIVGVSNGITDGARVFCFVVVLLGRVLLVVWPFNLLGMRRKFGLSLGLVLAVVSHEVRSRCVFLLCIVC